MKKIVLYFFAFLLILSTKSFAQPTTAYDFNMNDCNGKMHHLFSELDSGNVVIMEYFMLSCSPCIVAGDALEAMYTPLKAKYGNKVRYYHFAFTNSYTCTQVTNWITTNGYTSVPFDSGGVQTAYYGGMGMPTVAVVAGKDHKVLYTNVGFPSGDTAIIADSIHAFFNASVGILNKPGINSSFSFYPNPAVNKLNISLNSQKIGKLHLTIRNLEGQEVADLLEENIQTGAWNKTVSLPPLADGFYFLHGKMNEESFTRKISVLQR